MFQLLKGMKDKYFDDAKKYDFIVKSGERVFKSYGFEKVITPILEETELFKRSVGDDTDVVSKEMYSFLDKSGKDVSMRPEGTAGVVRAYRDTGLFKTKGAAKWYYHGTMYRYEAPQKGRMREFNQIGIEAFGIKNPFLDAEIIKMGLDFLERCGITNLIVEINSLGNSEDRKRYIDVLRDYMSSVQDDLCDNCKARYMGNTLRVLDCKNPNCQKKYEKIPLLHDYLNDDSKKYYAEVKRYLDLFGINYIENQRLVRGLDYYCDTVFEIKSNELGAQSAVLSGGRYDMLLDIICGTEGHGIGFAAGMERIALLLPEEKIQDKTAKTYVVYFDETKDEMIKLVDTLRKNDIHVLFDYNPKNFSTQMKKANKAEANYVIIIGEDEVKQNKYTLKDFTTGNQENKTIEEILNILKGEML